MERGGSGGGLTRRTMVIIIGALLVLAGVGGFRYAYFLQNGTSASLDAVRSAQRAAGAQLAVHVKGAVTEPGLYWLDAGSRVSDAVEAAGGALAEADLERLNLAAVVEDGSQLYVPYAETDDNGEPAGSAPVININTATLAQLETLEGIGETKAQAIIDYRESHGDFTSVEQLTRVTGIGETTLDKIRERVSVY